MLRVVSPGKVLAGVSVAVIALSLVSANTSGLVVGWLLLAIGLFNAIMFPTIFTLASVGLGRRTAEGSGLLCVAIVGGAIVPPLMGYVADSATLQIAFVVPALCYLVIAAFGLFAARKATSASSAS